MKKLIGLFAFIVLASSCSGSAKVPEGLDENWSIAEIPGMFRIYVPPVMEVRQGRIGERITEDVGFLSLSLLKLPYEPKTVLQPKGMQELDSLAWKRYARIIVQIDETGLGNEISLSKIPLTKEELKELDKDYLSSISYLTGMGGKILSAEPLQIVSVNGMKALKSTYERISPSGNRVHTDEYSFFHKGRKISVTLAYYIDYEDMYKDYFEQVISTFVIFK